MAPNAQHSGAALLRPASKTSDAAAFC